MVGFRHHEWTRKGHLGTGTLGRSPHTGLHLPSGSFQPPALQLCHAQGSRVSAQLHLLSVGLSLPSTRRTLPRNLASTVLWALRRLLSSRYVESEL